MRTCVNVAVGVWLRESRIRLYCNVFVYHMQLIQALGVQCINGRLCMRVQCIHGYMDRYFGSYACMYPNDGYEISNFSKNCLVETKTMRIGSVKLRQRLDSDPVKNLAESKTHTLILYFQILYFFFFSFLTYYKIENYCVVISFAGEKRKKIFRLSSLPKIEKQ